MSFSNLSLQMQVHLVTAAAALILGIVILSLPKGDLRHRRLAWVWVVLMFTTATATVFIRDYRLPNVYGYTLIHLFTVLTFVSLPLGIYRIRTGNVRAHQKTMKGLFFGGCVVAGIFTLLPGRYLGNLLWHQLLGLT